jgi:exodeoxyribonuclease V alpha subunit
VSGLDTKAGMEMIEITAIFEFEKFRFANADGDMIIGDARIVDGERITIKGIAAVGELQQHLSYRFYGYWTEYDNKRTGKTEKQFAFKTFVSSQPHGRAGIITYLRKAGEGHNIGQATAIQIWERFGADAVRILREQPEVVATAVKRLSLENCQQVAKVLKEKQGLEDCTIELASLLDGKGFPKTTIGKAIRVWGNKSAEILKKDPYQLMHFRGCGFKRCDSLYLELGLNPTRLRRQAFCAWYSIASNTEGHTWFPAQVAADGVRMMIGGAEEVNPKRAIQLATRICKLNKDMHGALSILREDNGAIVEAGTKVFVAEGRKAYSEEQVASAVSERISDRSEFDSFWPTEIDDISEHQQSEVLKCLRGSVCILGGSPGTGKTYTAARVIYELGKTIGFDSIAVAAPTGKAAVRITQAMQAYGLPLKAKTWHSLLGVGETDSESGNWQFDHHEGNPWPFQLIVGDESSMIDTNLMSSIMRATAKNCRLLLIGDVNQLPPVGHGAPLRDLIRAGVPYGELREIKRNSGGIVEACAAIRDGQQWEPSDNLILAGGDQLQSILDELAASKKNGLDPVWGCQILVAVNEKSKLSRKVVNEFLQSELNQNAKVAGTLFRINDKVVCLKNSDFPLIESDQESQGSDQKARVMNGELGKVIEIADKYLTIRVDDPYRLIRVPRGKSEGDDGAGCNWDLGYALSCHKSQGSEWPVVIVLIDEYPGAKMVCSREWIYTAISRAKQKCILAGKKSTADLMCKKVSINKRKTFLSELILLKLSKLEMAGL